MERDHLIIIALILVALYMMNKDDSKDTVQGIAPGPLGRIRYTEAGTMLSHLDGPIEQHIRHRREGFETPDPEAGLEIALQKHIRLSDKYIGGSQHIKNHIRSRNTNTSFGGLMGSYEEGQNIRGF